MERLRQLAGLAGRLGLSLLLIGAALWGGLALSFRAPSGEILAGILAALLLLALFGIWSGVSFGARLRLFVPFAAAFVAILAWWTSLFPRADREWEPFLARQPRATIEGDRLTVENVRDFRWRRREGRGGSEAEGEAVEEIARESWETRTYDLSKASGVDLFFSYWSGPLIAHVITSVTFDDQPPLAFSVEIRRERGEAYSALAGFFKSYELTMVAADERDVIRLRTDAWREDVRLYRLTVGREKTRELLVSLAREMNDLAERPRWYDTLGANCTTVVFGLARALWPDLAFDLRVLFSGRAPEYAHAIGAVRTDLPFAELRDRAAISEVARALPDETFSAGLRAHVPAPHP